MNVRPAPHFVREVAEQPEVLQRTIDRLEVPIRRWWTHRPNRPSLILTVGHGSSANAGLYAQHLLQQQWNIPVMAATPELWLWYRKRIPLKHVWLIGLSQSGETPDVVEMTRVARKGGAYTLALTNAAASPLANTAHVTWVTPAGPERAIPTSKTFTAQLMIVALLATAASRSRALRKHLGHVPQWTAAAIRSFEQHASRLRRLNWRQGCLVVGRSFQESAALETAMKLREAARVLAAGLSTMEFLHTSMALSDRRLPLVVFEAKGALTPHYRDVESLCRDRKLPNLWITNRRRTAGASLYFPEAVPEWLAPIPSTVFGQLLSISIGQHGGWNIDGGSDLHKVTRVK